MLSAFVRLLGCVATVIRIAESGAALLRPGPVDESTPIVTTVSDRTLSMPAASRQQASSPLPADESRAGAPDDVDGDDFCSPPHAARSRLINTQHQRNVRAFAFWKTNLPACRDERRGSFE